MATLYTDNWKCVRAVHASSSEFNNPSKGKRISFSEKYYLFEQTNTLGEIRDFILEDLPSNQVVMKIYIY